MPRTRQSIIGERPVRQYRSVEGVTVTQNEMQKFFVSYEELNRTEGTDQIYRRKQQLYQDLPEERTIRHGTLKKWQESLLQQGYTLGSVNAFLSAENSYRDYVDYREYQLPEQRVEASNE